MAIFMNHHSVVFCFLFFSKSIKNAWPTKKLDLDLLIVD